MPIKELYNKIFLAMLRSFPRMFSSGIILSSIVPPKNILDVGCGDGKTFDRLKLIDCLFSNKLVHAYSVGIDIYIPWLKEAKKVYDDVVCCDCRFLPFRNETFDIVMLFEVIEHLNKRDVYKCLRESII
ncbi:MAG: class I SAM-dependent methyltransferase [Nitrososphaerota archaeon]